MRRVAVITGLLVGAAAWAGPPFHALDALPTGELVLFDPAGPRIARWDGAALHTVAEVPGKLARDGHMHNVWVVGGDVWVTAKEGDAWRLVDGKLKRDDPPPGVDVDDPAAVWRDGTRVVATRASDWDVVERTAADGTVSEVYRIDAAEPYVGVAGLAALADGSLVVMETRAVRGVSPDGTVADLLAEPVPQVIGAAEGAGGLHVLAYAKGGVVLYRVGADGRATVVQATNPH